MRSDKPEYLKLYEFLRDEITRGAWPLGARLPSRRQIAVDRGLSAVTVDHSYELLCQEGYAEARPRSGFYVTYRRSDGFAAPESQTRSRANPAAYGGDETLGASMAVISNLVGLATVPLVLSLVL